MPHFWFTKEKNRSCSDQILNAIVVKVSAALREAVQQDFDQTLVPARTHRQETVLDKQQDAIIFHCSGVGQNAMHT